MNEQDLSIFQEIDDALRADKVLHFWQRYKKVILAGCACIVLLTAVSAYWKNYLHEQDMKHTHILHLASQAAEENRFSDAVGILETDGSDWPENMADIQKLMKAKLLLKAKQNDKAIIAYTEIAQDAHADEAVHDAALIMLSSLKHDVDITPATATGHPFAFLALQVKASSLIQQGKNKEAADLLKQVLDNAPPYTPAHERATELLRLTQEGTSK